MIAKNKKMGRFKDSLSTANFVITKKIFAAIVLSITLILFSGCNKDEIRQYEVEVEVPRGTANNPEKIVYTSPQGWTERGQGSSSGADFVLPTSDGSHLEASFRLFADMSGSESFVLNMMRGEAGLGRKLEENEVREMMNTLKIGDGYGISFEVISRDENPAYKGKLRIVIAMLHRSGATWFFKYAGNIDESTKNQESFFRWLSDMKFTKENKPAPKTITPTRESSLPNWSVPDSWTTLPPSSMVPAKFQVTNDEGEATISISTFPGDVGGLVPNVSRWRRQVGLPEIPEAEYGKTVSTYEVDGNTATLVDLSEEKENQKESLIAVWDLRGSGSNQKSWFYKIQGEFSVVNEAKKDFFGFIDSVEY